MGAAVGECVDTIRRADHAGQQRRGAASRLTGRRDGRRLRRQLAGQLPGPVPGHPGCAASSCARPTARRSSTPAAPARSGRSRTTPHTAPRSGHCGASPRSPPPSWRRPGIRVNAVFPGPVETPMLDEKTQARLAATSVAAGSVSRWRSPTPWRSWSPSRRRSSPVPNSSSTADSPADRMSGWPRRLSVGIIGAGPGGLALGIFLKKAGFRDFTIFDREDGVGGTWRINTYPGLACDVKSHLYSYLVRPECELVAAVVRRSRRSWSTSNAARSATSSARNLKLNTEVDVGRWDAETADMAADHRRRRAAHASTSWCRRSACSPSRCCPISSRRSRSPVR